MRCYTPLISTQESVAISLLDQGERTVQNFSSKFQFLDDMEIWSFHPSKGPTAGFYITISGYNLDKADTYCIRSNDGLLDLQIRSSSVIRVWLSSQPSGYLQLAVYLWGRLKWARQINIAIMPSPRINNCFVRYQKCKRQIVVIGSNLEHFDDIQVVIHHDDRTFDCIVHNDSISICDLGLFSRSGNMSIEFKTSPLFHDQNFIRHNILFPLEPQVIGINPTVIGLGQSFAVTIFGKNFPQTRDMNCLLRSSTSAIRYLSSSSIICECPAVFGVSTLSLQIVLEGCKVESHHWIHFTSALFISRVYPTRSLASSQSTLTICGKNFMKSMNLTCEFPDSKIPAIFTSSKQISCPMEHLYIGLNSFQLSWNNHVVYTDQILIISAPRITKLHPSRGPLEGGNLVTIHGNAFLMYQDFKIYFDMNLCPILLKTHEIAVCRAPRYTTKSIVEVFMSVGKHFLVAHKRYSYQAHGLTYRLEQSIGPASGGSIVFYQLRSTPVVKFCQFGSKVIETRVASRNAVSCKTPEFQVGLVNGYLLGEDKAIISEFKYFFHPMPSIRSCMPSVAFVNSGSPIVLYLDNLMESKHVFCCFNNASTHGSIFETSKVRCIAPPNQQTGLVNISISYSQDCIHDSVYSSVAFKYLSTFVIQSAFQAWEDGNNQVIVQGLNFVSFDETHCKVGMAKFSARCLSSTKIVCVVSESLQGNYTISLFLNDIAAPQDIQIQINRFPLIYHAIKSDEVVTLVGAGFSIETSCLFNAKTISPTSWKSSTKICCQASKQSTFDSVQVVQNGRGSNLYMLTEHSIACPRLISMSPTVASVKGGTVVRVVGVGFLEPTYCRFGQIMVKALNNISASSFLYCKTPSNTLGNVDFNVGNLRQLARCSSGKQVLFLEQPRIFEAYVLHDIDSKFHGIKLTGRNFPLESPICTINDIFGVVRSISNSQIACLLPKNLIIDCKRICVQSDGFPRECLNFTTGVKLGLASFQISPSQGPLQGGQTVTIIGQNIGDCDVYFESIEALGITSVSNSELLCTTPAFVRETVVKVSVVRNGQLGEKSSHGMALFSYYQPLILISAKTQAASDGTIIINGKHFRQPLSCTFIWNSATECRVTSRKASLQSSTAVTCNLPHLHFRHGSIRLISADKGKRNKAHITKYFGKLRRVVLEDYKQYCRAAAPLCSC
eukprot:765136-Hanusia_phi.AAC.2